MTSEFSARRISWIALALSLLATGVGHIYCGRIAKGLPLYFAWLLLPIGAVIAAMTSPSSIGLGLLVLPALLVILAYIYAALDSWNVARRIDSDYSLQDYNRVTVYGLLIVVQFIFSIGLIAGTRSFLFEAFLIPSKSMSPTILSGDRILARKLLPQDYFPQRGDLVVYRNPTTEGGTRFVGRVVALAGDEVSISGQNVSLNGKELERDRVPNESLKPVGRQVKGQVAYEENSGRRYLVAYADSADEQNENENGDMEATIPKGHVFVLGDNRDRSRDSRHFGSIHAGEVVGHVDYIYWPSESWSRFGLANDQLP